MNTAVLVLDATWAPFGVIPWQQAVCLVLDHKARVVTEYAGRVIRSANLVIPWPAVVALDHHVARRRRVRFNRNNVLARDSYSCGYCGSRPLRPNGRPDLGELTLDHVVPRAQAKQHQVLLPWNQRRVPVTSWENIVACCVPCNARKADRTPTQARMPLRYLPRTPTPLDALRIALARLEIPAEWNEFVPLEWRDYWEVDLDET